MWNKIYRVMYMESRPPMIVLRVVSIVAFSFESNLWNFSAISSLLRPRLMLFDSANPYTLSLESLA